MQTILRIALIYLLLLLGLRALGKREFGQLSPFELVTLLLIPELVSQGAVGDDFSITTALIAVSTLLLLVFLTSAASHRFPRVERFIGGEPAVLAHDGRFVPHAMDAERVSAEEIYSEMRKVGLERLSQVRWVVLEADGKIAIVPRRRARRHAATPERQGT